MKQNKVIIQFICYSPRIYSGFDRYNVLLAEKLVKNEYLPVFVFTDSTDDVPAIAEDLENVGARIELIPSSGKLSTLKATLKLYLKYKPKIVHTHFVNFIKIISAFFSFIFGSKHFTSFHSTISLISAKEYKVEKGWFKSCLILFYYRILLLFSNSIFTVSEAIKKQFMDFADIKSDKIQKLYLGVDLTKNTHTKVELRTLLGLPEDKILLCNIAAFEYIKGMDIWCKAVNILKHDYKMDNFLFCHLGGLRNEDKENADYRASIYALVRQLDIEDKVIWMGQRNDINEIISSFDIYVHPSRMEGLGVAIMEAATQSLPIIGSNVGGIPEIVINKENGFLFESENAEQLAQMIAVLINDISLRKKMGNQSYQIVCKNFDINTQSARLIDKYLSV